MEKEVKSKLDSFEYFKIKLENNIQKIDTDPELLNVWYTEVLEAEKSIKDQICYLSELHDNRQAIESEVTGMTVIPKTRHSKSTVPLLDLNKVTKWFESTEKPRIKKLDFSDDEDLDNSFCQIRRSPNKSEILKNLNLSKLQKQLSKLKKQHRLEEEGLDRLKDTIIQYEGMRKEWETKVQDLWKKNILLEHELACKTKANEKLENFIKYKISSFPSCFYCGGELIESCSKCKIQMPNNSNNNTKSLDGYNQARSRNREKRVHNLSEAFSEREKVCFKTPDVSCKNLEEDKDINTERINKQRLFEMKSGNKSNNIYAKSINLSDILKTSIYDFESEVNLIDEEIISSDMASLSQYDYEINKQVKQCTFDQTQNISNKFTPSFANRSQSKISLLMNPSKEIELDKSDDKISNRFDGKHLDMSLGDIPEEYEDNCTISDNYQNNRSSSFSKSDNINNSHSTPANNLNVVTRKPLNRRAQGSGDSRFSTYMWSDNLNKVGVSYELSNSKSHESSFLINNPSKDDDKYLKDSYKANCIKINLNKFMQDNESFENNENQSLVSNSGNKDMTNFVPNREPVKPRRIF